MSEHWNIQINIQHVFEKERPGNALARGMAPMEKVSIDVLKLAVVADTEAEAYEKAHRMLVANHPDVVVVPAGVTVGQDSGGRYRPVRDNPQA